MGEAKVIISAEDRASSVINRVTNQLGLLNKQGLAMGVSFALVDKAVQMATQAFQGLQNWLKEGIKSSRELQMNLIRITNTVDDMNISVSALKDDLEDLGRAFGIDVNVLASDMQEYTRQGYNASESIRLVGETQKFASATGQDFSSTVETMNTVMQVFGLSANDSAYIFTKLNNIVDETNLNVEDIGNVFARAAPKIKASGYSLDQLADILYTLEQEGDAPRTMLAEINDVLKDIESRDIDILPEDEVKSIEEKWEAIDSATSTYWSRYKEWMADAGRKTVDFFGGIFDFWAGKVVGAYDAWMGMYGKKEEPVSPIPLIPETQINPNEINTYAKSIDDLADSFKNASIEIDGTTYSLKDLKTVLSTLYSDMEYLSEQLQYTIDFHDIKNQIKELEDEEERLAAIKDQSALEIEMANTQEEQSYLKSKHTIIQAIEEQEEAEKKLQLQKDLAATTKQIADTTEQMDYLHVTHEITLEIQKQQDEVEKLQRISDQYSLSQQKNSLEILKIEYEAMGRRGGKLTRGEQYEISQIEQENALLQIQEMENQIAIGDIQTGALEQTQDELDAINRIHDEFMYRSQIDDLNQSLSDMYERQEEYENEIAGLATSSLDSLNAQLDALEATHDEYLYGSEMQRLQQALTEQQEQWQTYTDTINGIETNALQLLYDQLDDLQEAHNEAMYNKEIEDLTNNLTEKYNLIAEYESAIETLQKQTALEVTTYLTGLSNPPSVGTSDQQNTLNTLLQAADAVTSGQDVLNTLFATSVTNQIPGWKWMQGGGHVYETGPYILHRGEEVIPSGKTENYGGNQITINISAVINKDMDVDTLAQRLRSAISKNLLDSNGGTNYRLR